MFFFSLFEENGLVVCFWREQVVSTEETGLRMTCFSCWNIKFPSEGDLGTGILRVYDPNMHWPAGEMVL